MRMDHTMLVTCFWTLAVLLVSFCFNCIICESQRMAGFHMISASSKHQLKWDLLWIPHLNLNFLSFFAQIPGVCQHCTSTRNFKDMCTDILHTGSRKSVMRHDVPSHMRSTSGRVVWLVVLMASANFVALNMISW